MGQADGEKEVVHLALIGSLSDLLCSLDLVPAKAPLGIRSVWDQVG